MVLITLLSFNLEYYLVRSLVHPFSEVFTLKHFRSHVVYDLKTFIIHYPLYRIQHYTQKSVTRMMYNTMDIPDRSIGKKPSISRLIVALGTEILVRTLFYPIQTMVIRLAAEQISFSDCLNLIKEHNKRSLFSGLGYNLLWSLTTSLISHLTMDLLYYFTDGYYRTEEEYNNEILKFRTISLLSIGISRNIFAPLRVYNLYRQLGIQSNPPLNLSTFIIGLLTHGE